MAVNTNGCAPGSRWSRDQWLTMMPPALLIVVAVFQIILTQRSGLSPWKGGGFGMFATLDGRPHRSVHVQVDAPDRSEHLAVPVSLDELASAVEILPTPARLEHFARAIADRERRHGRPVGTVLVEVWRTEFSPGTLVPTRRRIGRVVFRADR